MNCSKLKQTQVEHLKPKKINKLNKIDDLHIIAELKVFLDFELAVGVNELSKDQQSRIMEAKAEYLNSKDFDDSIADQEIEKWLDGKLYGPNLQMRND